MVRAILDGAKTQTRRIIGPQPDGDTAGMVLCDDGEHWMNYVLPMDPADVRATDLSTGWKCPYGAKNDTLWVRETHAFIWPGDHSVPERECNVEYRADTDGESLPGDWPEDMRGDPERPLWRPSIHMPRWASRLTLRVENVRVERLQDISEDEAKAEGIKPSDKPGFYETPARDYAKPRVAFQRLWESINGAGSWEANPWVWVVEFTKLDK